MAVRSLIEQNINAVERLANVESVAFVQESLSKLPGSRHTARFEVHVTYEKKIDLNAECERLKKELEKIEREAASGRTAEELLRRLVRAVLDHQGGGGLRDDATLLLVQWTGT